MFINLVRIQAMRLFKSRTPRVSVLVTSALFACISFFVSQVDYMSVIPADYKLGLSPLALIVGEMEASALIVATTISAIVFVRDYYKNRLMINIEGAVRNRSKICLSEIAVMGIWSGFLAFIIVALQLVISIIADGPGSVIISGHRMLILIIVWALLFFEKGILAIAVTHLVRNTAIALIICSLRILIVQTLVFDPARYILTPGVLYNVDFPLDAEHLLPPFIILLFYIIILCVAACIFCRRKYRI